MKINTAIKSVITFMLLMLFMVAIIFSKDSCHSNTIERCEQQCDDKIVLSCGVTKNNKNFVICADKELIGVVKFY